jgi:hypothetical protein
VQQINRKREGESVRKRGREEGKKETISHSKADEVSTWEGQTQRIPQKKERSLD